jgi:hypothetical protein
MRSNTNSLRKSFRADSITAGIIAGIVGGVFMAILMMTVSGFGGMGFWHPIELAGGVIYGANSILGGVGPILTGIVIHLAAAALFGAGFGAILPAEQVPLKKARSGASTGWGIFFGILIWGLITFLALPLLNQTMKERVDLAPGWWFLSFLVYGSVLGITPMLRRAIGHNAEYGQENEDLRAA